MHILIAPNAFKNSLCAEDAADAIRHGIECSGLMCSTRSFPIGDGGDGTAALIIKHRGGVFYETQAQDALGRKIQTSFGFLDGFKTAVIEMSEVSGLRQLQQNKLDPLHASSFGTGELIKTALDKGAKEIILAVGGSATIDGGSGILQALGFRFLDHSKKELNRLPENLSHLDVIDTSGMDKRIRDTKFIVLCDVNNFLLGEKGAAAIFGPQKGASKKEVVLLENALCRFKDVSLIQTGKDMNALLHGGAAGGTAAALNLFLNARLLPGIDYFLDITDFDKALDKADLLITGEGSIDLQTLEGKGPFGVASRAKKKNIPVIGLAGQIPLSDLSSLEEYFDVLLSIGHQSEDAKTAMHNTAANLEFTAYQIGKMIALKADRSG